ncbi:MAG: hypothetical protein ACYTG6_09170 [Planctomycetota bacterium]|jgi:hypothetical protein
MSRRGASLLLLAGLVALMRAGFVRAEEPSLPELRARLISSADEDEASAVLDALAKRVGSDAALPDAGALGDWLGRLPPDTARRYPVRLHRAWAYLTAMRGDEAVALLRDLLVERPGEGVLLAYLGEGLRQSGAHDEAVRVLLAAARTDYAEPFLRDSVLKTAFELRRDRTPRHATSLPEYGKVFDAFLALRADALLHAVAARWMLDDHRAYADSDTPRTRIWAAFAGRHALAALRADPATGGGARLALDAALALEPADRETEGRTPYFDLLAWAYRLGDRPDLDAHEIPQVMPLLAEAALAEGRYELAYRMARRRLDLSDSPAARRVLERLPPDVGD